MAEQLIHFNASNRDMMLMGEKPPSTERSSFIQGSTVLNVLVWLTFLVEPAWPTSLRSKWRTSSLYILCLFPPPWSFPEKKNTMITPEKAGVFTSDCLWSTVIHKVVCWFESSAAKEEILNNCGKSWGVKFKPVKFKQWVLQGDAIGEGWPAAVPV